MMGGTQQHTSKVFLLLNGYSEYVSAYQSGQDGILGTI